MFPHWLPNLHPLVIHFPVVLFVLAVVADWVDIFYPASWRTTVSGLYVAAAAAAGVSYWTGLRASEAVFVPGMAHPLIDDHRVWALRTTWVAFALALAHVLLLFRKSRKPVRLVRLSMAVAGLAAMLAVYQTAERGGRLVYEQGVGVIAGPGTR